MDRSLLFLHEVGKAILQLPQLLPEMPDDLRSQFLNLLHIFQSLFLYLLHYHSYLNLQILNPSKAHRIFTPTLTFPSLYLGYQRPQNAILGLYLLILPLDGSFQVEDLCALAMYLLSQFQHPSLQSLYKPFANLFQVLSLVPCWFGAGSVRSAEFSEGTTLDLLSVVFASSTCLH